MKKTATPSAPLAQAFVQAPKSGKTGRRKLVDLLASDQLLQISDRMWMQNTGTRTPIGAYGTFWDDKKETKKLDQNLIDDLL